MSETIKLPAVLPGDLNLTAINQKLRNGTAQLDWSAVVSAPQQHLQVLLAELDIAHDADALGIDGAIADHIAGEIIRCLETVKPKKSKSSSKKNKQSSATPQLWQQPNSLDTQDVAVENPQTDGRESLVKKDRQKDKDSQDAAETQAENNNTKILNKATPCQIRKELETAVLNDLLGPAGGEEEEIEEDSVSDRYLVGLLAPLIRNKNSDTANSNLEELPEQQDELAIADKGNPEEGSTESNIPAATTMFPSSMGITFCVSGEAEAIEIIAKWGRYERENSQYSFKEDGTPKKVWKRYPMQGKLVQPLIDKKEIHWVIEPKEIPEVYVTGKIRRLDNDWIITLFLVNGQKEPAKLRDRAWLFQPQLIVGSAEPENGAIFIRKPLPSLQNLDPLVQAENQAIAMLYRHQVEFAVGHGVSVSAELPKELKGVRAISLATSVVPSYEVAQTTTPTSEEIPELAGLILDMKVLAEANSEDLPQLLKPLTTAYSSWIDRQEQRIDNPAEGLSNYRDPAQSAIANCRKTLERICEGIITLETNPQAIEAFQFMNRAMWQQRIHSIYAEEKRRGKESDLAAIDISKNRSWRGFQLAFILLNLASIIDLNHRDRTHPTEAIADLLWFPTGGGKTEAYLGLTAYTIGLRRLQGVIAGRDGEHGVAVLMRYTLRLLTLQQFQRATALICACEEIRRQDEQKWGKEPFRIGLWVGQNSTPNYTSQSEEFIKQARGQINENKSGSPHQLTNCPWCGSKIDPGKNITVETFEKGRGRTFIKCGDLLGSCAFSKGEGLPVLVVDEEIYRRLPTLLIATVDKFAQMPWKGEVQMLFGQVNGYCQRHGFRSPDLEDKDSHKQTTILPAAKTVPHSKLRPPDLIIQDELHLISGPLGSLVGLYETAVERLACWEVNGQTVRPKVIASTATIRQASQQVHNLFLRQVRVFPPQGLDIQDNFFSRQRTPCEQTPGRRYLGICAPGRRLKAAIIRVYLALLAASQSLYEKYGEAADPWMTLVGYFNSLRELAGTRRLVDDDIATRLARMDRRGLAKRTYLKMEELTSRKDSTEIPQILDRLETPFDPKQEAENKARRKAREKVEKQDPLDVILATNMISVGVDVKRLGAMVVCGQPKNTAEYIQATSRVGRTYPGLVITVYNWARPRDLSHYERFEHYHATFYQHVEALSVTPFASGALYRGLTALLVSLVRLAGEEFNGNDKAGLTERNHPYVKAAIEAIVERASFIEGEPTGDRLRQELAVKLDRWLNRSTNLLGGATLKYQVSSRDGTAIELLKSAGRGEWQDFTCLNALRNVEPTIGLILTERFPDDESERLPQPFTEV